MQHPDETGRTAPGGSTGRGPGGVVPAPGEGGEGPSYPGESAGTTRNTGNPESTGPGGLSLSLGRPGPGAAAAGPGGGPVRPLLHGFRPGRAVAGLAALAAALLFAGDAAGSWSTPWFMVFPVVFGGLALAAGAGLTHYTLRRRRVAMSASRDGAAAPASTSGSQAIR
ncbi:hypothetical protein ACIQ9E_17070 [Streptomyces sp. NPDC094448]|uniref:hypothetical protein n=1 Tax=Streptomyces sp. NPDC094448 TaxID=3366063 RepID=UPI0038297C25